MNEISQSVGLLICFGTMTFIAIFFAYLGGLFSKKPAKVEIKPNINLS